MKRILVIDDTRNIRNMVRLTLTKAGHEVELAEDGTQGLLAFGDGSNWGLTLIDQRMPGEQGDAVITEIRRRDPAARVIMMTSFATVELAAGVIAAGVMDFLRKPFNADVLRGAVAAALARPRQANQPIAEQPTNSEDAQQRPAPLPPVSYHLNGYGYWIATAPDAVAPQYQGFEIACHFEVRGPSGATGRSLVGITPHVREQIQAEAKQQYPPEHPLWETLCQQSLSNYLWENAAMPPEVLPVYELTAAQLETVHRAAGTAESTWRIWRV